MLPGHAPGPGSSRRTDAALSPRALPSDTSVRFLLLLAAVASASLFLFSSLWSTVRGQAFLGTLVGCGTGLGDLAAGSVADTALVLQEQAGCRSGLEREQAVSALAGTALVLLLGWLGYRVLPRWRVRRARLVRLDEVDGAALHGAVAVLAHEAGLGTQPRVLVDVANPGVQAFVLGTSARPVLGATGGLVVLQVTDPPAFRAVVRHELAHLAARDVPWAFVTVAVWWAFVGLALVPVLVVLAVSDLVYVARLGWRAVVLAVLVLLLRNAVLRAREAYADALAAELGSHEDLDRVLAAGAGAGGGDTWGRHLLRRHPTVPRRRRLLADPDGLFVAELPVALAAGLVTATSFQALESVSVLLLPPAASVWVPAVLVAPLLAVVLCVGSWRAGLRAVARGRERAVAWPLGLGAGAGMALGPLLTFEAAAGAVVHGPVGALGYVVWGLGVLGLVCLLARYAADAGRLGVRAALGGPSPRTPLLVHVVAVTAATAALLAYGHLSLLAMASGDATVALGNVVLLLLAGAWFGDDGLLLLLVACAVVAPLLLAARRPSAPGPAPGGAWAWRDRTAPVPDLGPSPRPRLRVPLLAAALLGLAAVGWHLLLRGLGPVVLDDATWRSDRFAATLGLASMGLVAVAAVLGGLVAVALLPSRWWPLGVLGGAVSLLVGGLGVALAYSGGGCGLLPRAGPRDCSPPTPAALWAVLAQPTGLAVLWLLLVPAVLGVLASVGRAPDAVADLSGRPSRSRLVAVPLVAVALLAAPGAVAAAVVAATELTVVTGPGYEVTLEPPWTVGGDGASPLVSAVPGVAAVPAFRTIDQRVRAQLVPVPDGPGGPLPEEDGPVVGGVPSRFLSEEEEGPVVLRRYAVEAGPGRYELRLVGAPAALEGPEAEDELERLLSRVRWTG